MTPLPLPILEVDARFKRHHEQWNECTKCVIGTFAQNHVFYRGTLPCEFLFIGEGPGVNEDLQGEPFVGKSGQLVDKWLGDVNIVHKNITTRNARWAITNLVLCRPTDNVGDRNRPPSLEEVHNCRPRLLDFVAHIARPNAMIIMGKPARKHAPEWPSIPVLYLPHPAWVLRRGGEGSPEDELARQSLMGFIAQNARRNV